MGHTAHPYGTTYLTGAPIAREPAWEPDLIIFMECGDQDRQYIELRERYPGAPLVMWMFDTGRSDRYRDHHKSLVQKLKPVQLYLANPDMLPHFAGSKYLPYAADETRFKPTDGNKSGAAIIGSPFPARVEFARKVGVDVVQTQTGQEYADAVARLQVHVHHTNSGGDGLLVMRYWETLACGTVLLCPDSEAVMRHFDHEHLITYSNVEDCRELIKRLDPGMSKRWQESLAASGRAHVLAHHTYRNRAQEILESI